MKNTCKLICLLLLLSGGLYAQIFSPDRIKNRVKNRAEERTASEVDSRVDRGVDKVLDGIFGGLDKAGKDALKKDKSSNETEVEKNESSPDVNVKGLLDQALDGLGQGAPPASTYNFDVSYSMQMTSKTRKYGEQIMQIQYRFPKNNSYFGADLEIPGQNSFMVYDFEKNSTYTFMDMNGQAMMMSIAMKGIEGSFQKEMDKKVPESTFQKTGKTKKIVGYTCDGYLMKQDKTEMLAWISREKVPVISDYYLNMAKASGSGKSPFKVDYHKNPAMLKMMQNGQALLGMDWEEKEETYQMEIINIDINDKHSFSTGGYKNMMQMGN